MEEILVKNNNISHIIVKEIQQVHLQFHFVDFITKKIIHLEAGLRTYNNKSPFPEEVK